MRTKFRGLNYPRDVFALRGNEREKEAKKLRNYFFNTVFVALALKVDAEGKSVLVNRENERAANFGLRFGCPSPSQSS